MTNFPVLPEYLVLLLPFVTTALTGWLGHDALPRWANATIALISVLIVATVWALFNNAFAGDLTVDITVIAAYCAALMAGPLKPLEEWLQIKIPSPFSLLVSSDISAQAVVPSKSEPQPLEIGAANSTTPPKASPTPPAP